MTMTMKAKATLLGAAALLLAVLAAPPAQADFGLSGFEVRFANEDGTAAFEAGTHPFSMTTSFGINYSGEGSAAAPDGEIKDAAFRQITGLALNPAAKPACPTADFLLNDSAHPLTNCAPESKVGEVDVLVNGPESRESDVPVYNLEPPPGSPARLGFVVLGVPVVIDGAIESEPDYNLLGELRNTRQVLKIFGAELTLFGDSGETPFITLPSACGEGLSSYEALSWEGERDSGSAVLPEPISGCEKLPFAPEISARPTSDSAETSSGLDFSLGFDQEGLTSPGGRAQSTLKEISVALPQGVTVNPSIAEGLGVCTPAELDRETLSSAPGEGCPNASKIGTVSVHTPLLGKLIPGSVYLAPQDDPATAAPGAENPFDSLIAFHIVLKDPELGVLLKVPAKVEPDPATGQLVTSAADLPQIPFSRFDFHFREGQRAPLSTPPRCGTYTTRAQLTPWARPGDTVPAEGAFQILRGPGGGPCPNGAPPFDPGFEAGSLNNNAATHSPFLMRLTRADGEQDLTRFAATLPPGVTGKLAGIAKCSDAAIARARAIEGREEAAAPSCPAASLIGSTLAGAGLGGALTYVPGALHLAGPYNGAPLSVVAITPALAGPFDAGTVVVRVALRVDPVSAEVTVDGAASDPIPHILKGIVLKVRDLRVFADRPGFALNPTNCREASTEATIWGSFLDVLNPADDISVGRAARYQTAGCADLGFKPRLHLRLRGGVRRGAHPALRAVYRPRAGQANLQRLALAFPRSAFVENAHFRTICTRVQFAAEACPKGSVYGRVRAFTPLLDEPLEGPVYLRSSNNNLPDAVFVLRGLVDIEVAVRIDSVRGRLRATVQNAPDVPVSKVVVNMRGAKKGLFVNSRHLCAAVNRGRANFRGQNGKRFTPKPVLRNSRCKQRKRSRASHARR